MQQYVEICRHQVLLMLATSELSIEEESKHLKKRYMNKEVTVLIYEFRV